jgi:hypothetical protein
VATFLHVLQFVLQRHSGVGDDLGTGSRSTDAQATNLIQGMTRICAWCRRIKAVDGTWQIGRQPSTEVATLPTHGICPDCRERLT